MQMESSLSLRPSLAPSLKPGPAGPVIIQSPQVTGRLTGRLQITVQVPSPQRMRILDRRARAIH